MRPLGSRVLDVSLGPSHGACLLESGHVVLFGDGEAGQLGATSAERGTANEPIMLKVRERTSPDGLQHLTL